MKPTPAQLWALRRVARCGCDLTWWQIVATLPRMSCRTVWACERHGWLAQSPHAAPRAGDADRFLTLTDAGRAALAAADHAGGGAQ